MNILTLAPELAHFKYSCWFRSLTKKTQWWEAWRALAFSQQSFQDYFTGQLLMFMDCSLKKCFSGVAVLVQHLDLVRFLCSVTTSPESPLFLCMLGFNQKCQLSKFRHLRWWLNCKCIFSFFPISSHALVTHRDSFGLCNWCKSRIIFLESLQDIIVSEIINISFYVYKWSVLALEFEGELNSTDLKINRELQNLKHLH